jgi:hypothetical protein
VTLERYASEHTERFAMAGRRSPDGRSVSLELRDAAGALRYAATLDLDTPPPPASERREPGAPPVADVPRQPWDGPAFYSPSSLFHGLHFQVLRSIDAVSESGASGTLSSARDLGWPRDVWHADPAALDGALQLAFLFGLRSGGGPSLPMRIARLVVHGGAGGADTGPLRCELTQRERSRERLLCDLSLTSAEGRPLADLVGVEMFAIPSGTTASS